MTLTDGSGKASTSASASAPSSHAPNAYISSTKMPSPSPVPMGSIPDVNLRSRTVSNEPLPEVSTHAVQQFIQSVDADLDGRVTLGDLMSYIKKSNLHLVIPDSVLLEMVMEASQHRRASQPQRAFVTSPLAQVPAFSAFAAAAAPVTFSHVGPPSNMWTSAATTVPRALTNAALQASAHAAAMNATHGSPVAHAQPASAVSSGFGSIPSTPFASPIAVLNLPAPAAAHPVTIVSPAAIPASTQNAQPAPSFNAISPAAGKIRPAMLNRHNANTATAATAATSSNTTAAARLIGLKPVVHAAKNDAAPRAKGAESDDDSDDEVRFHRRKAADAAEAQSSSSIPVPPHLQFSPPAPEISPPVTTVEQMLQFGHASAAGQQFILKNLAIEASDIVRAITTRAVREPSPSPGLKPSVSPVPIGASQSALLLSSSPSKSASPTPMQSSTRLTPPPALFISDTASQRKSPASVSASPPRASPLKWTVRPYREEWIKLVQSTAQRPEDVFVKPVPLVKATVNSLSPSPMTSLNDMAGSSNFFTGTRSLSPPLEPAVSASPKHGSRQTSPSPLPSVGVPDVVSPAAVRPLMTPLSLRAASPHVSTATSFSSPSSAFAPIVASSPAQAGSSSGSVSPISDAEGAELAAAPASAAVSAAAAASVKNSDSAVPIPALFHVPSAHDVKMNSRSLKSRPATVTVTGQTTYAPSPKHSPKNSPSSSPVPFPLVSPTPLTLQSPMMSQTSSSTFGGRLLAVSPPTSAMEAVSALPEPMLSTAAAIELLQNAPPAHVSRLHVLTAEDLLYEAATVAAVPCTSAAVSGTPAPKTPMQANVPREGADTTDSSPNGAVQHLLPAHLQLSSEQTAQVHWGASSVEQRINTLMFADTQTAKQTLQPVVARLQQVEADKQAERDQHSIGGGAFVPWAMRNNRNIDIVAPIATVAHANRLPQMKVSPLPVEASTVESAANEIKAAASSPSLWKQRTPGQLLHGSIVRSNAQVLASPVQSSATPISNPFGSNSWGSRSPVSPITRPQLSPKHNGIALVQIDPQLVAHAHSLSPDDAPRSVSPQRITPRAFTFTSIGSDMHSLRASPLQQQQRRNQISSAISSLTGNDMGEVGFSPIAMEASPGTYGDDLNAAAIAEYLDGASGNSACTVSFEAQQVFHDMLKRQAEVSEMHHRWVTAPPPPSVGNNLSVIPEPHSYTVAAMNTAAAITGHADARRAEWEVVQNRNSPPPRDEEEAHTRARLGLPRLINTVAASGSVGAALLERAPPVKLAYFPPFRAQQRLGAGLSAVPSPLSSSQLLYMAPPEKSPVDRTSALSSTSPPLSPAARSLPTLSPLAASSSTQVPSLSSPSSTAGFSLTPTSTSRTSNIASQRIRPSSEKTRASPSQRPSSRISHSGSESALLSPTVVGTSPPALVSDQSPSYSRQPSSSPTLFAQPAWSPSHGQTLPISPSQVGAVRRVTSSRSVQSAKMSPTPTSTKSQLISPLKADQSRSSTPSTDEESDEFPMAPPTNHWQQVSLASALYTDTRPLPAGLHSLAGSMGREPNPMFHQLMAVEAAAERNYANKQHDLARAQEAQTDRLLRVHESLPAIQLSAAQTESIKADRLRSAAAAPPPSNGRDQARLASRSRSRGMSSSSPLPPSSSPTFGQSLSQSPTMHSSPEQAYAAHALARAQRLAAAAEAHVPASSAYGPSSRASPIQPPSSLLSPAAASLQLGDTNSDASFLVAPDANVAISSGFVTSWRSTDGHHIKNASARQNSTLVRSSPFAPLAEAPPEIAAYRKSADEQDRELQFAAANKPRLTAASSTPRRQARLLDEATDRYLQTKADPRSFEATNRDDRDRRNREREQHLKAMHSLHPRAPAEMNTVQELPTWKNLDGQRVDYLHDSDRKIGPVARAVHAVAHPPSVVTSRGQAGSHRFAS